MASKEASAPLWFWKFWEKILDFGIFFSKILKIMKILKILIYDFQSRKQILTLSGVYVLEIGPKREFFLFIKIGLEWKFLTKWFYIPLDVHIDLVDYPFPSFFLQSSPSLPFINQTLWPNLLANCLAKSNRGIFSWVKRVSYIYNSGKLEVNLFFFLTPPNNWTNLCRYSDILKLARRWTSWLEKLQLCWANTKPGGKFPPHLWIRTTGCGAGGRNRKSFLSPDNLLSTPTSPG